MVIFHSSVNVYQRVQHPPASSNILLHPTPWNSQTPLPSSAPLRGSRLNPPWWITRSTQNILEGVKGPFGSPILTRNEWESGDEAGFEHIILQYIYIIIYIYIWYTQIWQYLYTGYYWIPCGNLAQQCEKSPIFYGKTSMYWKTKPLEMHFRQTWPHLPGHRFSIFFLIPASSNCQSTKHPLTTPWLSGKKRKNMFQFHSQSLWGDLTSHMYTR